MRTIRTKNPAVRVFDRVITEPSAVPMTVQGTINKTILLFLLTFFSATITWKLAIPRPELTSTLAIVGVIGGLALGIFTIFSPKAAKYTSIFYVLFEGLFLGAISAWFNSIVPGIVWQAILLTFAVFGVMLFLYKAKILKASPGFVKGIVIATGGLAVFYIGILVVNLFGGNFNWTNSLISMGIWGIVIQLFIVGLAALNLILDFNFIEQGSAQGMPQYMEWYGAFSLMVTLIWLYIEILRLLFIIAASRR